MMDDNLPTTDNDAYKPISGFALTSLFLGGGFAALALLSAGVGIVKGAPIFYPIWLLLVPIAGFIFGLLARKQIIGPDRTRAGLPAAQLGIALALLSGLGYAAYFVAVGLAVTAQANTFLVGDPEPDRGYFTHLTRSAKSPIDLDLAFLLTRPATGRIKLRGADDDLLRLSYDAANVSGGPGDLTTFRRGIVPRLLGQAGDQAKIEPLGVRSWSHEKASYKVARDYRIHTPEAILDVTMLTESTEAEIEGQLRQWFVNLNGSQLRSKELTALGRTVDDLRQQARAYLDGEWRSKLPEGQVIADLAAFDATDWPRLFRDKKELSTAHYKKEVKAVFQGKANGSYVLSDEKLSWPNWGRDGQGRFWIEQPFGVGLGSAGELPAMVAQGTLRVRTKDPFDPATAVPPPRLDWVVEKVTITHLSAPRNE